MRLRHQVDSELADEQGDWEDSLCESRSGRELTPFSQ